MTPGRTGGDCLDPRACGVDVVPKGTVLTSDGQLSPASKPLNSAD
jgi:hypothetical protein